MDEAYCEFCRRSIRTMLTLGSPDVIFNFSRYQSSNGDPTDTTTAGEFCEYLGFDAPSNSTFPYEDENSTHKLHTAEINEWPNATVISVEPHFTYPSGWAQEHLDWLKETAPQLVEDAL